MRSHGIVHGILQARILEWVAFPFSRGSSQPRDLPNPGIKPRSLAMQADSLPAEPAGKPKNTVAGRLSLLQWIFLTQELNQGLLHCRWILFFFLELSVLCAHLIGLNIHLLLLACVLVAQTCLTLCNPIDCSPASSCAHGIFQASILEWVAISFSRGGSFRPKDWTHVSCVSYIAGRFFTRWAIQETHGGGWILYQVWTTCADLSFFLESWISHQGTRGRSAIRTWEMEACTEIIRIFF